MKKILTFLSLAFLLTSCAFHMGSMNSSASLSSNNFKYVKLASGQAETIKFLGLGGLSKEGLVAEAKKNLLKNNPLKDGQALANIVVDFKYTYLLLLINTKAIITADIVEFNK